MAVENEIKLRLPLGPEPARALLEGCGFRPISGRELQTDQAFDLPSGQLRAGDRLLRLRSEGAHWTVTYKGPAGGGRAGGVHKSREELETEVFDGPAFAQILAALGYQPSFAYEKFRTTFQMAGDPGVVTLDETPIGTFLELEGPESWIDATALRLGFRPEDYITSSYAAIYDEYRRSGAAVPLDMKFHRP